MADRFDKFTQPARNALTFAQEEAQRLKHNYIGTEHLLLGLTRETDSIAAIVLRELGVLQKDVRSAVLFIVGRGETTPPNKLGLTPRAKKVIELAVDEARRLNHSYIGTEHILLGLAREGEGIAFGILESRGVTLPRLRSATVRILARSASEGLQRPSATDPRPEATLVPLAPNEERKALAESALRRAQAELSAFTGSGIEQTLLQGFVVPRFGRLLASLDQSVSMEAVESVRADLMNQLGPLRGLADAFREAGHGALAEELSSALDAYSDALRS
jgi:hypothetical protein